MKTQARPYQKSTPGLLRLIEYKREQLQNNAGLSPKSHAAIKQELKILESLYSCMISYVSTLDLLTTINEYEIKELYEERAELIFDLFKYKEAINVLRLLLLQYDVGNYQLYGEQWLWDLYTNIQNI